MDPRLYMLAGTFALLVIALIATVISFIRATRRRRLEPPGPLASQTEWSELPPAEYRAFDTSLEGLEVKVSADSPSAALLMPLRTGTWTPPEAPAPAEVLPEAALETRIATFPVAEPSWASALPDIAADESSGATALVDRPEPPQAEVVPESPVEVAEPPVVSESFSEVQQATVTEPSGVAPISAMLLSIPEVIRETPAEVVPSAEPPTPISVPIPAPDSEQTSVSEPMPERMTDQAPGVPSEPVVPQAVTDDVVSPPVAAEAAPLPDSLATLDSEGVAVSEEPVSGADDAMLGVVAEQPEPPRDFEPVARPEPDSVPIWLPPQVSEVPLQTEPQPSEAAAPAAFWESVLREQQDLPTVVAADTLLEPAAAPDALTATPALEVPLVLAPAIERPSVVVHGSREEITPEPALSAPESSRPPRPRAVVRVAATEHGAGSSSAHLAPLATPGTASGSRQRDSIPELAMAAPVEMWFGDHRVGVKHGTKTYDQFRRYADALFDDLRATGKLR